MTGRRGTLCGVLGMACYWSYFRRVTFDGILFQRPFLATGCSTLVVFLVALAVLAALSWRHAAAVERLASGRTCVPVLAGVGGAGAALVGVLAPASPLGWLLYAAGACAVAAGFLALTYAWAAHVARCERSSALTLLFLSFVVSFLLMPAAFLPHPAPLVFAAAMPCACGLAWRAAAGDPFARDVRDGAAGPSSSCVSTRLAGLLVVFILLASVVRCFAFSGGVNISLWQYGFNLTLALAMLAVIRLSARRGSRDEGVFYLAWIGVVVLIVAGLFLVVALDGLWPLSGAIVVVTGREFLSFLLWVALALLVRDGGRPVVRTYTAYFVVTSLASWTLSYVAVPAAVARFGFSDGRHLAAFSFVAAAVLVAGSLLFLSSLVFERRPSAGAPDPDARRARACGDIAARYRLTSREAEVLRLLSQGHSYKKVAETLSVSLSTVQSHTSCLYNKLDIHSQQGVIDFVDAWPDAR